MQSNAIDIQQKTYLCKGDYENFTVKAMSLDQAKKFAAHYGGKVIRELEKSEVLNVSNNY